MYKEDFITAEECVNYLPLKITIFIRIISHCTQQLHSMYIQIFKYFLYILTAGNRHMQNSWFCKEIREDNFRCWWRRVHEDASQGMYMSKIEIFFFTSRILQNQRMLCCGECFHD